MVASSSSSSLFAALDKDGDGKVSACELRACMAAARLSEEEAAAILAAADADGDGLLDHDEFLSLLAGAAGAREEEAGAAAAEEEYADDSDSECLREAFRIYAAEGGEVITPASLRRMLCRLGSSSSPQDERVGVEECRAMICRFDLDGDGVLSFQEFRVMMHDGPL